MDASESNTKMGEAAPTASPLSPRPMGFLEMSSGLALDRGPAFSPAQLSMGRKMLTDQARTSSQDSLPFAEEDASLVETPDWDRLKSSFSKHEPQR